MNCELPSPISYLNLVVRPVILDFHKHPNQLRYIVVACTMLYHLKDYIAYHVQGRGSVERELRDADALAFEVVRTIATATKHGELDAKQRYPFLPYDITYHSPSFAGEMFVGQTFLGDTRGGFSIRDHNGNRVGIRHCVDRLMAAYHQRFGDLLGPV